MNALDRVIRDIQGRSVSIDAPLTMESIEDLTDEELQALYEQYGLALYYPDISRDRRNWMLYNMARIWRYLGTPKAIEYLCQYIFGDIDIELVVHDNGAFDAAGNVINPELVDVFDVEVMPGEIILPPEANQRILDNVIRFSRNSQALRQIYYSYDTFITQTVSPALPYDSVVAVQTVQNTAICDDAPVPIYETITIYFNSNGNVNTSLLGSSSTTTQTNRTYTKYPNDRYVQSVNISSNSYEIIGVYESDDTEVQGNFFLRTYTDSGITRLGVININGGTSWIAAYIKLRVLVKSDVYGYFRSTGSSSTTNTTLNTQYWNALYKDEGGEFYQFDATKTYTPIAFMSYTGSLVDASSATFGANGSGDCAVKPTSAISTWMLIFTIQ